MITKFNQYNEGKRKFASFFDTDYYKKVKSILIDDYDWTELKDKKIKELINSIFKEFEESEIYKKNIFSYENDFEELDYASYMNDFLENIATGGKPERKVTDWFEQESEMGENLPPKLKSLKQSEIQVDDKTYLKAVESEDFIYFVAVDSYEKNGDIIFSMDECAMYRKSDKKLVSTHDFFVLEQGLQDDVENDKILWNHKDYPVFYDNE